MPLLPFMLNQIKCLNQEFMKNGKSTYIPKENKQEICDCLSVYLLSFRHRTPAVSEHLGLRILCLQQGQQACFRAVI